MTHRPNIYTHIDADELISQKNQLLDNEFNEPVVETFFEEKKSIYAIVDSTLNSSRINKILRKNEMMNPMNVLFEFIVDREFEKGQKLTFELRYEDKEEWGGERDNLNVSIQLEKVEL